MAISIPRTLVEFILLGPEDDRRQLQDSPILGDVWVEFARNPAATARAAHHALQGARGGHRRRSGSASC